MNDAKYIGYAENDIANTMWPSGLCRVARRSDHKAALRLGFGERINRTARHSFRWLG